MNVGRMYKGTYILRFMNVTTNFWFFFDIILDLTRCQIFNKVVVRRMEKFLFSNNCSYLSYEDNEGAFDFSTMCVCILFKFVFKYFEFQCYNRPRKNNYRTGTTVYGYRYIVSTVVTEPPLNKRKSC